jgi:peptidoglycan/LPS O-acetylase OafA/YrhL
VVYVLASAVTTLALAVASYHLIERRCMDLKNIRVTIPRTGSPERESL